MTMALRFMDYPSGAEHAIFEAVLKGAPDQQNRRTALGLVRMRTDLTIRDKVASGAQGVAVPLAQRPLAGQSRHASALPRSN